MKSINLYIFDENVRASVYGIGTYLKELATSLQNSIVQITVIHLNNGLFFKMEKIDGVTHWYIPGAIEETSHLDFDSRAKQYYRNIKYLMQLHITEKQKLVFHLNFSQNKALAEMLRESFECKLIFTIHYLDWCFSLSGNLTYFRNILECQKEDLKTKLKKLVIDPYHKEKELFEKVDNIICLSEKTRQVLLDDYTINPDKTTVIYNGLTDKYPKVKEQELRKKYQIPAIPVFLFAGRLDSIKGVNYLLQAFKTILDKQEKCHLIIAGSGSFDLYMKECEDIWMNVTWTGLIDRAKLYDLYSIADVGLMPSLHEQCSYVAIEMMMHGVPLIASTSTGLSEMVEDGVTGLHIPVIEHPDRVEIDTPFLAEKMLYLLKHPKERRRMGVNARKRYEKLYTAEVMRENMLNFYTTLYDT